jgi:hypothetical protein
LCQSQRATVLQLPARGAAKVHSAQPSDSTVVPPIAASVIARVD